MNTKKVAIVYDWMDSWGGVERLLIVLHDMYPHADFFTSYYEPSQAQWAKDFNVHTSFINRLPSFIRKNRVLSLPLYPYAFESFDFTGYDMVISVTSAFAKAVITRPETVHICYLLTPPRYLWSHQRAYIPTAGLRILAAPLREHLRRFDAIAAQRPDHIVTLSHAVAERCLKYYRRTAEVIYPPFDIPYWETVAKTANTSTKPGISSPYYLLVSRLEPYKNVPLVLEAFAQRPDLQLIIVGKGRQKKLLQTRSPANVTWLENPTDSDLAHLYGHAEALIMPQEEDFGYVALEAQFFGCPVISLRRGGALETVIEGKTGLFFDHATRDSLLTALEKYHTISYNIKSHLKEVRLSHSEIFAKEKFVAKFSDLVGNFITIS